MTAPGWMLVAVAVGLVSGAACGDADVDRVGAGPTATSSTGSGGDGGAGSTCGDEVCDPDESPSTCAADCGTCGNGACDGGEDFASCPEDGCTCGNGACDDEEDFETCPEDGCTCGDDTCGEEESPWGCPRDCYCGNASCDQGEWDVGCPEDCFCGNGICERTEDFSSCPEDGCTCGDGVCDPGEGPQEGFCGGDCPCGSVGWTRCGDTSCRSDIEICVESQGCEFPWPPTHSCAPIPVGCETTPTCACVQAASAGALCADAVECSETESEEGCSLLTCVPYCEPHTFR